MKLTQDSIQYINLFERLTRANVKACFINAQLIFIVEQGYMSKAIGKNGINVKKFENLVNKKIKIVEYSKDPVIFVKNLIFPLKIKEAVLNNDLIEIQADTNTKALLIGRNSQNLAHLNDIIKNYFNYKIKVR